MKSTCTILASLLIVAVSVGSSSSLEFDQRAKKMGNRENPEYEVKIPIAITYVLSGLLVLGVIFEIFFNF